MTALREKFQYIIKKYGPIYTHKQQRGYHYFIIMKTMEYFIKSYLQPTNSDKNFVIFSYQMPSVETCLLLYINVFKSKQTSLKKKIL